MKQSPHLLPSGIRRFSAWLRRNSHLIPPQPRPTSLASHSSAMQNRSTLSLSRLIAILCISLIYAATIALITHSTPTLTCNPIIQPTSSPSSSSKSGWHDTDVSAASQGKLWTAQKFRIYPSSQLLHSPLSSATPTKIPPLVNATCSKWAVVTTIFAPSKTLYQLRALSNWCLVVVGDRKTDDAVWDAFTKNFSKTTVYLSASTQSKLPYHITSYIPWNHFGRKNLGYIFAIHHGAKLIWDTDDDNVLQNDGIQLSQIASSHLQKTSGVIPTLRTTHALSNPYPYFRPVDAITGDRVPHAWPRGLPLPLIKSLKARSSQFLSEPSLSITSSEIGAIQSLADSDPDVDAFYRLSHPLPLHFTSSRKEKLIALPIGRFAPFNAQATLWSSSALFATLLPVTVHGRVSDIWRAYFSQTIFKFLNLHLAFHAPAVTQIRNAHAYIADLQAEIPLYTQSGALVDWLKRWKPISNEGKISNVRQLVELLWVELYEVGILESNDINVIQSWLKDLEAVGYQFPPISRSKRYQQEKQAFGNAGTEGPEGHEMLDNSRVPQIAVCVHGSSAPIKKSALIAIANSVHELFSRAAVTLFAVSNDESSCFEVSSVKRSCVTISLSEPGSANASSSSAPAHMSKCSSAISAQEVARDEEFHWILSMSHNSPKSFVHRLPSVLDASMNRSTVFRSKCEASVTPDSDNDDIRMPAMVLGKPHVMRELFTAVSSVSNAKWAQRKGTGWLKEALKNRGIHLGQADDMIVNC